MTYLDGDIPPILIAHGTKDRLVAFKQSVKLYKALKDKNKEVIFLSYERGRSWWTYVLL